MANTKLFEPDGLNEAPGLVIFGFDQPTVEKFELMGEMASEIFKIYQSETEELPEEKVVETRMVIGSSHPLRGYRI